jgi:pimeloyl-ACP methyl ester carboxylesterase
VFGPLDGPLAVVVPGSASTADFVLRAFGPALAAVGIGLVSGEPAAEDADLLAGLDEAAERYRPVLVGGVSRGAHAAARWAANGPDRPPAGLLLALPAWTGSPDAVAAASAAAADEVDALGVTGALRAIRARGGSGWVLDELSAAWPRTPDLAAALRATARSAAPTLEELARVELPCGVVALRDDPLHPADVARDWAATLRHARLAETHLAAVGRDRATIGRGAVLAWLRARAGLPSLGRS